MNKLMILLAVVLASGCVKQSEFMSVPARSCKSHYTGQTRSEAVTEMHCFSYDSTGQCTTNIPTTRYVERQEVSYVCKFNEWV